MSITIDNMTISLARQLLVVLSGMIAFAGRPAVAEEAEWGNPPAQLQTLIRELANNNQNLQALSRQARALRLEAPAVAALPDPVVGFGLANVPIDSFSLDKEAMTQKQVFVAQKIPWLGSLTLQEQIAQLKAMEAETRVVGRQLGLESQLSQAWYDLSFLSRSLTVNRQLQTIVTDSLRIAESRYGTGTGSQQDILMAQVKLTEFLEEESSLISRDAALRARLGGLLNRPAPLVEPVDFAVSELPAPSKTEDLVQLALKHNPEIGVRQFELQRAEAEISLARKAYLPDFDLRLSYGQREDSPDTGDARSDFLSATVALSVPLYQTRKQDLKLAAARERREAAHRSLLASQANLTNEIHRLAGELAGIRSGYELLRQPLRIQVGNLEDASLAAYSTGKLTFEAMLQARVRVLRNTLAVDRYQTEYSKKMAELRELTGKILSPTEAPQ